MTCQASGQSCYIHYFILSSQHALEGDSIIIPILQMKRLRPRVVFASLARGENERVVEQISLILEFKNLTALTLWERKHTGSFHLSFMAIHSFSHCTVFFLFSWFLHRWTVSELNNLLDPLVTVLGRDQSMTFFQELFNLMPDPEGKI